MSADKILTDTLTIVTDGCNIGKIKFEDIAERLGMIAGCGTLIKDLINILKPARPDPVMQKLNQLERKIGQLSDKMSREFDNLKAFMVEHHFYADLAQTASTLMKFLQDAIRNPCNDSYNIFRDIAAKKPPLQYAYKMISLLEQQSTNPLKMAMKADVMRTTATFNKWRGIIDGVITQFLFLETWINGMFWQKNMYGPNELKERIRKLNRDMDQWRNEYKNSYWDTIVEDGGEGKKSVILKLIQDTQDKNTHVGNEEKAVILQRAIGTILTDDSFYVLVYNHCGGYDKHSFYGPAHERIESFRRGGCCVVVYRSRNFNRAGDANKKRIEFDVESCRYNTVVGQGGWETCKWLKENRIANCGLVALIQDRQNVKIKTVNTPGYQWGPGWWITLHPDRAMEEYKLIAGYN